MNLALIILVGIGLLGAYFAVCWVLALLRNMAVDLAGRALRWLLAWVRRRLAWRRFAAQHATEFAGPEFQWPAPEQGWTEGVPW